MAHFHCRASLGLVRYSQALLGQAHVMLRFHYSLVAGAVTLVTQCRRSRDVIFNANHRKATSAVSCQHSSSQLLISVQKQTKVKQVQTTDCLCHGGYSRWFIYVCIGRCCECGRSEHTTLAQPISIQKTRILKGFSSVVCLQTCHSINSWFLLTGISMLLLRHHFETCNQITVKYVHFVVVVAPLPAIISLVQNIQPGCWPGKNLDFGGPEKL